MLPIHPVLSVFSSLVFFNSQSDNSSELPFAEWKKAIEANNVDWVDAAIRSGCDIHLADEQGNTILHLACAHGRVEIIIALIDAGASGSVNIQTTTNGYTPLHYASFANTVEMVELLLAAGANANIQGTMYGDTPLHIACLASTAEMVKMLLTAGANVDIQDTAEGKTALHIACLAGKTETVRVLLAAGANVDIQNTAEGKTPLHVVCAHGTAEIVELLLDAGADVNIQTMDGFTPLSHACNREHVETVRMLLEAGARADASVWSGVVNFFIRHPQAIPTLEELRTSNADESVFRLLLGEEIHGRALPPELVIDARAVDESDYTPLHWAAWKGNVRFAKALIAVGADINAETGAGMTPLNFATFGAKGAGVKELLEEAGAALGTPNDAGVTCEEGYPPWGELPHEVMVYGVLRYLDPVSICALAPASKGTNNQVKDSRSFEMGKNGAGPAEVEIKK